MELKLKDLIININIDIDIMTKKTKQQSFEKKELNGKPNPKYVDMLTVDKKIAGQEFVCVSFCSPEKILERKEMFFFGEFLKQWEFNKSMEKFMQFINFVTYKYNISQEDVTADFSEFIKEEKKTLTKSTVKDDYDLFMDKKEEQLQKQFDIENKFQTNVRGVKIRGVYPTQEEAELRCKILQKVDPHHDIFVGHVGEWLLWDPNAYKTGRVEFMDEELNQLMHEKLKNETNAKDAFEQRVKETKEQAIKDNVQKAEKSGNVLSQTIDESGNLVGVNNVNTSETALKNKTNLTISDVRTELFEGDNIVVDKSDNGQSELLSGPFANKE